MAGPNRIILGTLIVAALFAAGCEERVVGTRNDWVGSQLDRVQPRQAEPDKTDDFFDETGEALFGWTRKITGEKKKPKPRPAVRDIPLDDRLGH